MAFIAFGNDFAAQNQPQFRGERKLSQAKAMVINMSKAEKTNVGRILDGKKIPYQLHSFGSTGAISGTDVAKVMGEDPAHVFKTLVTVGKSGQHYVFVIPVAEELDLKKAATAVGEKNIEMIPQKELLPLTGYIHGGCSPIGMKKFFPTAFHKTASDFETILFSGGKIGFQVELTLTDLEKVIPFQLCDLTVDV